MLNTLEFELKKNIIEYILNLKEDNCLQFFRKNFSYSL